MGENKFSNCSERAAEGNILSGKRGGRHHKRQRSKGRVRGGKGRQQNPPFGVAKLGLGASMRFGLPVSMAPPSRVNKYDMLDEKQCSKVSILCYCIFEVNATKMIGRNNVSDYEHGERL